jgi:4-amino-4-deoxychorismate lyase
MNKIQFIETMHVVDGRIDNLQAHVERMRRSVSEVYGVERDFSLLQAMDIPSDAAKCRIVYDEEIRTTEFSGYTPRDIRTLRLVQADADLDYHLKYLDRTALNRLRDQRADADEVLIVREGFITDTSFSNVVFTDGRKFVTPSTCLLPGTRRARLLASGVVTAHPIRVDDIAQFTHIALINAMLPLDEKRLIPVTQIKF